jgi:hypothetical protein
MATDYQGNSRKSKEEKPAKSIEKIVTGEVVPKKKSIGKKFKETFILADPKSVFRYVLSDVMLPAARMMVIDATYNGLRKILLGETVARNMQSGSQSRTVYQTPVQRGYSTMPYPSAAIGATSAQPGPRRNPSRHIPVDTYLFTDKNDAERTLQQMQDIIDQYDVVTLADFNTMAGLKGNYTDEKWGWAILPGADIQSHPDGWLLILPPPEAVQ